MWILAGARERLASRQPLDPFSGKRPQGKPHRLFSGNPADRLGLLRTSNRRAAVDRPGPLPVGEGAVHVRPPRPHANRDPGLKSNRSFEIRFLRAPTSLSARKGPESTEQLAAGSPDKEDSVAGGHQPEDDRDHGLGAGPS